MTLFKGAGNDTKIFQALSLTVLSTTVVNKFKHCRQQHLNAFYAVAVSAYNLFTPSPSALKVLGLVP